MIPLSLFLLTACGAPEVPEGTAGGDTADGATSSEPTDGGAAGDGGADGGSDGGSDVGDDDVTSPSEHSYEHEIETEVFDQAAAEASLETFIDNVYSLNARPVLDSYFAIMDFVEEGCPVIYPGQYQDAFWSSEGCDTSQGALYDGYASYFYYQNQQLNLLDPVRYTGDLLRGVSRQVSPDGSIWRLEGEASLFRGDGADGTTVYLSELEGWFSWDHASASDTWIGDDRVNPNLEIRVEEETDGGRLVEIEGGVSGLRTAYDSIYLERVKLGNGPAGYGCALEPDGSIWLRASSGDWFRIVFDMNGNVPSGPCDGCGQVYDKLEVVGEACADFSPMLGWVGPPW